MGCSSSAWCKKEGRKRRKRAMSTAEKVFNAAVLIQTWYRRYLALKEVRRRCSWVIFQSLEYEGDQDQAKLHEFFKDLISCITSRPALSDAPVVDSEIEQADDLIRKTNWQKMVVEDNYDGPHLCQPLAVEHVMTLIESFKAKKALHAKYVFLILAEARMVLMDKPNISFVSTAFSRQVTVCGDLHGKFEDLLTIFYKNGLPSNDNPYVFNGDYVDRGEQSIEVLLLLLACMVVWPNSVYLNRGNHEDFTMNIRYGFVTEVLAKYTRPAAKILQIIEDIYGWLPLASIIDNKVFVVHGGISNDIDINEVNSINRHQYLSVMGADLFKEEDEGEQSKELNQIVDLLWSDPHDQPGCSPNVLRGGGSYFGPDVTNSFLEKHHLQMIIRSHECKADGYEFTHDGKVLTIFSACNYYDIGSNKGAYVKLVGPSLHQHIVRYIGSELSCNGPIQRRTGYIEQSAIRELKQKLVLLSNSLLEEFKKLDPEQRGQISIRDWCIVMEAVSGLHLPWHLLSSRIAVIDPVSNTVDYRSTLEDVPSPQECTPTLLEVLYQNKESLQKVFNYMDKDGSGTISMEEFREACLEIERQIGRHFQPEDIRDLAKSIDLNKDGSIDMNDFLEAFRLVEFDQGHQGKT